MVANGGGGVSGRSENVSGGPLARAAVTLPGGRWISVFIDP
jgi:hypothetical protein